MLIEKHQALYGIIASIFVVLFIAFFSTHTDFFQKPSRITISFTITIFSIILLFYWRYRITQTYREKLRLANQKSLEEELHNKTQEIAQLKADNNRLAGIIHKDNKLIPAMEQAVTDYLENSHTLNSNEQREIGHSLSIQLHNMAIERQNIISSFPKASTHLVKSGLHTVDGMLSFMETRCKNENITYQVQIEENITELIRSAISEEDLLHLLGDMIDNAIIATRYTNTDNAIEIHLGSLQKHFLLEIADTGVAFTPETYRNFGNEQYTTHPQEGGSGIGLMDIWEIKKKYRASLQIYEYPSDAHAYSKKITFVFDRKNHFLIQTYRYRELTSALKRGDIYVFPYAED